MNSISDFFLFIAATLVGNWLWQLWLDQREAKNQKAKTLKDCLAKIKSCILELEYNESQGIGGSKCPFKSEAQERLLHSEEIAMILDEKLLNSLKQLISEAGIINGDLTFNPPRRIKELSKVLRLSLQEKSEELRASSSYI